ncbi:MAG: YncE family protein [Acidobacteriota bacterium]|jgi:hypothetical protein
MQLLICFLAAALLAGETIQVSSVKGSALRNQEPLQVVVNLVEPGGLKAVLPSVWVDEWRGSKGPDDAVCAARIRALQTPSPGIRQALKDLNVYYLVTINAAGLLQVIDPRTGFGGSRLVTALDLQASPIAWFHDEASHRLLIALTGQQYLTAVDTTAWRIQKRWNAGSEIVSIFPDPSSRFIWTLLKGGTWVRFHLDTGAVSSVDLPGPGALTFADNGAAMLSTKSSSWLIRETTTPKQLARQSQQIIWSTAADAFVSLTANGSIELWSDSGDVQAIIPLGSYPADSQLKVSEDGRFGLSWTPGRDNVRLIDLSRRRWRGELLIPQPTEIFTAKDFVYVRSGTMAENLVVPMEAIRGSKQVQGRKVSGGTAPHTPSRFQSIASLPGAEIVFWTAPADDQIYAYHPGMNAASGGLRTPSKPIGLLLAGPSLIERKPGEFMAEFTLSQPGQYIAVMSSQQPKRQACSVFEVEGDGPMGPTRFQVQLSSTSLRHGIEQVLQMKLQGSPRPSSVRMLVLAVDGQWQNRYSLAVDADGAITAPITLPRTGQYWLTFDIPSEPLSHLRFPRLTLEAVN